MAGTGEADLTLGIELWSSTTKTPGTASNMEDQELPVWERMLEAGVLSLICVTAVVSNISLWVVVLSNRSLRNESNYLILCLSLADLLVSVLSMPITVITIASSGWNFPYTMCTTLGYINMLAFVSSVESLGVISINRYVKICHPSLFVDMYSTRSALLMSASVWLFSGVMSLPPFFGWARYGYLPSSSICFCDWPESPSYAFFMIACCFCVPCGVMTICYVRILGAYRQSNKIVQAFSQTAAVSTAPTSSCQAADSDVADACILPDAARDNFGIANVTARDNIANTNVTSKDNIGNANVAGKENIDIANFTAKDNNFICIANVTSKDNFKNATNTAKGNIGNVNVNAEDNIGKSNFTAMDNICNSIISGKDKVGNPNDRNAFVHTSEIGGSFSEFDEGNDTNKVDTDGVGFAASATYDHNGTTLNMKTADAFGVDYTAPGFVIAARNGDIVSNNISCETHSSNVSNAEVDTHAMSIKSGIDKSILMNCGVVTSASLDTSIVNSASIDKCTLRPGAAEFHLTKNETFGCGVSITGTGTSGPDKTDIVATTVDLLSDRPKEEHILEGNDVSDIMQDDVCIPNKKVNGVVSIVDCSFSVTSSKDEEQVTTDQRDVGGGSIELYQIVSHNRYKADDPVKDVIDSDDESFTESQIVDNCTNLKNDYELKLYHKDTVHCDGNGGNQSLIKQSSLKDIGDEDDENYTEPQIVEKDTHLKKDYESTLYHNSAVSGDRNGGNLFLVKQSILRPREFCLTGLCGEHLRESPRELESFQENQDEFCANKYSLDLDKNACLIQSSEAQTRQTELDNLKPAIAENNMFLSAEGSNRISEQNSFLSYNGQIRTMSRFSKSSRVRGHGNRFLVSPTLCPIDEDRISDFTLQENTCTLSEQSLLTTSNNSHGGVKKVTRNLSPHSKDNIFNNDNNIASLKRESSYSPLPNCISKFLRDLLNPKKLKKSKVQPEAADVSNPAVCVHIDNTKQQQQITKNTVPTISVSSIYHVENIEFRPTKSDSVLSEKETRIQCSFQQNKCLNHKNSKDTNQRRTLRTKLISVKPAVPSNKDVKEKIVTKRNNTIDEDEFAQASRPNSLIQPPKNSPEYQSHLLRVPNSEHQQGYLLGVPKSEHRQEHLIRPARNVLEKTPLNLNTMGRAAGIHSPSGGSRSTISNTVLLTRSSKETKSERRRRDEVRLTTSLLVVVALFIVCWFPYCISMFMSIYRPDLSGRGLDMTALLLGYMNSCVNPIVYGLMNRRFKEGYKKLFTKCRLCKRLC